MPSTAIVWFRRDLRVHDHPPLRAALDAHERVVPVFVLDDALLHGRHASGPRTQFMLECLKDLRGALQQRGGNLVIARGKPERELIELAREPRRRGGLLRLRRVAVRDGPRPAGRTGAKDAGIEPRRTPGNFVADIGKPKPYAVFTPFWRTWKQLPRRDVFGAPRTVPVPSDLTVGALPSLERSSSQRRRRTDAGRRDRRPQADARVAQDGIDDLRRQARPHGRRHLDALARTCTSAPSPRASWRRRPAATRRSRASSRGATSTPTCCCTTRATPTTPTAASWTTIDWDGDDEHFDAWREGRTGYPVVDAGMRQLASTGWMHNRARLITACFLVKDLHIDWRRGERHFMRSCSTATRPTTTATGSGSPRSASTPRRCTGASTTRSCSRSATIPRATTSAAGSRSS